MEEVAQRLKTDLKNGLCAVDAKERRVIYCLVGAIPSYPMWVCGRRKVGLSR
ncbi:MAG: hypothetical protein H7Y36_05145 [Armatimonadetes bacterium]|nr:hypothetical protein [Akkermansiaceae bacterium]